MTAADELLRQALSDLVAAVDDGFQRMAVRIPLPGERRRIVAAADAARSALARASSEAGTHEGPHFVGEFGDRPTSRTCPACATPAAETKAAE